MLDELTLPTLARIWFDRSTLQHQILMKNIRRQKKIGTAVRQDHCTQLSSAY